MSSTRAGSSADRSRRLGRQVQLGGVWPRVSKTIRTCGLGLAYVAMVGCGSAPPVARLYDTRVVQGAAVPAEAYAAYLQGTVSLAEGDWSAAIEAFDAAAELDPRDPEIATRRAFARCALARWGRVRPLRGERGSPGIGATVDDRQRARASEKAHELLARFDRAFELDAEYAPAFEARGRCAEWHGLGAAAHADYARAVALDSRRTASAAFEATRVPRDEGNTREVALRLLSLTETHAEVPAVWRALGDYAQRRDMPALAMRAYEELALRAPQHSLEVMMKLADVVVAAPRPEPRAAAELLGPVAPRATGAHHTSDARDASRRPQLQVFLAGQTAGRILDRARALGAEGVSPMAFDATGGAASGRFLFDPMTQDGAGRSPWLAAVSASEDASRVRASRLLLVSRVAVDDALGARVGAHQALELALQRGRTGHVPRAEVLARAVASNTAVSAACAQVDEHLRAGSADAQMRLLTLACAAHGAELPRVAFALETPWEVRASARASHGEVLLALDLAARLAGAAGGAVAREFLARYGLTSAGLRVPLASGGTPEAARAALADQALEEADPLLYRARVALREAFDHASDPR